MKHSLIAALLVVLGAASVSAQYQVPQQTSYAMNQAERANLQLVHDFWRDIMLGGNLDIASHYMPATFISRNPNVAEGRDAFVQALRTRPRLFQNTTQRAITPEVQFAKNEYVFLMWANFVIDPKEPAKIFKYNTSICSASPMARSSSTGTARTRASRETSARRAREAASTTPRRTYRPRSRRR